MLRLILSTFAFALALAGESNWPQFRGPAASGNGDGSPPVQWNGEKGQNVLWKAAIPGLAHSSPIIWGDRIFVTSAVPASGTPALKVGLYGSIDSVPSEGPQNLNVYCLDRKSGKILWEKTAYSGELKFKRHPKATNANTTPATDGKHLAVLFGSEGLYVYDLNGNLIWKKDLGPLDSGYFQVPSAQWGFSSSPIIAQGKLIVQADVQKNSFVAAFDVATGKELWRTPRADVPTFGTPAVAPYTGGGAQSHQVVVNGWKHIGGYSLENGKELWRLAGGGDIPVPTPVVSNGLILITNAHGPGRPIFAIRPTAAGDITDSVRHIAWKQERAGNYMQTPLAEDGLGYFCMDNGVLTVFQLATGERLYQQRLGSGSSGFSGSPVSAGGRLYVTSEEGVTHVLQLGKEFKELSRNELGETVMSSPAVSQGVLFIRARNHLFAIGTK